MGFRFVFLFLIKNISNNNVCCSDVGCIQFVLYRSKEKPLFLLDAVQVQSSSSIIIIIIILLLLINDNNNNNNDRMEVAKIFIDNIIINYYY